MIWSLSIKIPSVCIDPFQSSFLTISDPVVSPYHVLLKAIFIDLHFFCRLFNTQRCARCNMGIQSTDLVMRARNHVYHVTCFTCFTCNKALQAGDTFGLRDHLVYCQIHYENSYHAEYIALSPDMNAGQLPYYNGVGTLQKGRPRKRRSPNISSDEFAQNIGKTDVYLFIY